jgi:NADH dehydrogenase FAD-containing subunit
MKRVLVLGSNLAGAAALEIKSKLQEDAEVTVVPLYKKFLYLPSFKWTPIDLRKLEDNTDNLYTTAINKDIRFLTEGSKKIYAEKNKIETETGRIIEYDELVIAIGVTSEHNLNFHKKNGLVQCIQTLDESIIRFVILITHLTVSVPSTDDGVTPNSGFAASGY